MTRKKLLAELSRCAILHGFRFMTGAVYEINSVLADPPMIWVDEVLLLKRNGRTEGTKSYAVTLRMIDIPTTPRQREDKLNAMEERLSAIAVSMCDNEHMVDAPAIEYATEKNTLTNRGEVSVKATLTIQTRF